MLLILLPVFEVLGFGWLRFVGGVSGLGFVMSRAWRWDLVGGVGKGSGVSGWPCPRQHPLNVTAGGLRDFGACRVLDAVSVGGSDRVNLPPVSSALAATRM